MTDDVKCKTCDGIGVVRNPASGPASWALDDCRDCNGTGKVDAASHYHLPPSDVMRQALRKRADQDSVNPQMKESFIQTTDVKESALKLSVVNHAKCETCGGSGHGPDRIEADGRVFVTPCEDCDGTRVSK